MVETAVDEDVVDVEPAGVVVTVEFVDDVDAEVEGGASVVALEEDVPNSVVDVEAVVFVDTTVVADTAVIDDVVGTEVEVAVVEVAAVMDIVELVDVELPLFSVTTVSEVGVVVVSDVMGFVVWDVAELEDAIDNVDGDADADVLLTEGVTV